MKNRIILVQVFILLLSVQHHIHAQQNSTDTTSTHNKHNLNFKPYIIPTALIGYSALGVGMESDWLRLMNLEVREEVYEHIDSRFTIDDISQYVPALSVYALNSIGIKGKNRFGNRTLILATSYLIMSSTVTGLKNLTHIQRPDSSAFNSFPSGHTATAFMGAEFLWQEYKDVSVWYGISGYVIAAGTGFFRVYNNRHWLTDVAAGAGIGMLSTKLAYLINPYLNRKLFGKNNSASFSSAMLIPFYNGDQAGISFAMSF